MSHVDEGTLHAYLDGALPPDERTQVEAHLAGCAECQERLAQARALVARADALLALALPGERAAPPLHELRRRPLWWRVRWPVAWAASIMLAVGLGWMVRGRSERGYIAQSAQDTASPTFAVQQHYTDEPRQLAGAPANRGRTGAGAPRQEAQNAPRASRADSAMPTANAAAEAVPGITPSIVARDRAAAPALKPAPPTPAAPTTVDGMIATGAAQSDHRVRAQPVLSSTWPIIQRASATRMLGTELAMIPGVPLRDIRMSPYSDGVVLVEQEIDSMVVIQLFQRRAEAGATDSLALRRFMTPRAAERERVERLARFVGPLRVEIAGPLGTDSLSKLLELVK